MRMLPTILKNLLSRPIPGLILLRISESPSLATKAEFTRMPANVTYVVTVPRCVRLRL
jgi:hypothetical protein